MSYGMDLLIGAQKAEFEKASRIKSTTLKLQVALGVLASLSVFTDEPRLVYAALGLTALGIVAWFHLNSEYASTRACAERLRHLIVIKGAFGLPPTPAEAEAVLSRCRSKQAEWERRRDPDYFKSKSQPGALRLKEMLAESAFWTKSMAGFAANEYLKMFAIAALAAAAVIYVLIDYASRSNLMVVTRCALTGLLALVSSDFLGAALTYRSVQADLTTMLARLEGLGNAPEREDMMIAFSDYNSIVEAMPLFANGLHERHEKELNKKYDLFLTGAK